MQGDKQFYFRWENCMRCEKRCRKRVFFGRENELITILCQKCTRELRAKNYARIYPSRRSIEHGYAIRRTSATYG
jgi:hypothetical protein